MSQGGVRRNHAASRPGGTSVVGAVRRSPDGGRHACLRRPEGRPVVCLPQEDRAGRVTAFSQGSGASASTRAGGPTVGDMRSVPEPSSVGGSPVTGRDPWAGFGAAPSSGTFVPGGGAG